MNAIEGPLPLRGGAEAALTVASSGPDTLTLADAEQFADLPLAAEIQLGEQTLSLAEVVSLETGTVLNLQRKLNSAMDLVVGGTLLARGDLIGDGKRLRFHVRRLEVPADR